MLQLYSAVYEIRGKLLAHFLYNSNSMYLKNGSEVPDKIRVAKVFKSELTEFKDDLKYTLELFIKKGKFYTWR